MAHLCESRNSDIDKMFFAVLAALVAVTVADITGSNPVAGTCLCLGSGVNIRDSACGNVIATESSSCYKSTGRKEACTLNGSPYEFFEFNRGTGQGWAAGTYLTESTTGCKAGGAYVISANCLMCIGKTESGCYSCVGDDRKCVNCKDDVGSLSCGMYQIKDPYHSDCGRPGSDWFTCTTGSSSGICTGTTGGKDCSEQCVSNYMDRYGDYCTGKPIDQVTCLEFAGVHNGGPGGCSSSATADYRSRVSTCCRNNFGSDAACN